jgi:long-subunit fatty acid transport protein
MKKFSLTLLAAGAMAVAGIAQADAIFYPDGTVVELGENGADNLALDSSSSIDTTVLGAAPAAMSVTTVTPQLVYVQPNINWDRATAMTQLHSNAHLMRNHAARTERQAAATFDVPARAGEASTMTGGAPNMLTDNSTVVVGSYSIPYTVVTEPYYVFSY